MPQNLGHYYVMDALVPLTLPQASLDFLNYSFSHKIRCLKILIDSYILTVNPQGHLAFQIQSEACKV